MDIEEEQKTMLTSILGFFQRVRGRLQKTGTISIGTGLGGLFALVAVVLFTLALLSLTQITHRYQKDVLDVDDDILWHYYQIARSIENITDSIAAYKNASISPVVVIDSILLQHKVARGRVMLLLNSEKVKRFKDIPIAGELLRSTAQQLDMLQPKIEMLAKKIATQGNIEQVNADQAKADYEKQLASFALLYEDMRNRVNDVLIPINTKRLQNITRHRFEELGALNALRIKFIGLTLALGILILTLAIGVMREIQQSKRLVEANLAAEKHAAQAEAGTRAKSAFLATMSHEIRTPLNGIIGSIELMEEHAHDPEINMRLGNIRSCSEQLLDLINQILDFSKIESGVLTINKEPQSTRNIMEHCLKNLQARAESQKVKIQCDVEECHFLGDGPLIRQILINLLGNAVKFTPGGVVTLKIALKTDVTGITEPTTALLSFTVSDNGIGIAEQSRERIFGDFIQAEEGITRRFGGTGLGLAISRRLVQAMDGTIDFTSIAGEGSDFWFTIPVTYLPQETMESTGVVTQALAPVTLLPSGRILVAEDNEMNREIVSELLGVLGQTVIAVADGQEAVEILTNTTFDLVLMDMQMPRLDGLSATRIIRDRGQSSDQLKIVALSANSFVSDRDACLEAGMDDFMSKPVTRAKLSDIIRKWVMPSLVPGSDMPLQDNQPGQRAALDSMVFDDKRFQALEEALGVSLAQKYLARAIADIKQLKTETVKAIKEGKTEEVTSLLHTIKGAAGTVALSGLEKASDGVLTAMCAHLRPNLADFEEVLLSSEQAVAAYLASTDQNFISPASYKIPK